MSSIVDAQALREAYKRSFVPRAYADLFEQNYTITDRLHQEELHRIFHSDLPQGKTLLDIGSGPSVSGVLSASYRFQDIVLSDYLEGNRLELDKWVSNSEDAIDVTLHAEHAAAMEGYRDINEGASKIQERTRHAIRKTVFCDVLESAVLPEEHQEIFDVVLSSNCLECVTTDQVSFRRVVRNVGTLVRPGGLLVLAGIEGVEGWFIGSQSVPKTDVTEDVIKQAVADAGFRMETYSARMHDDGKIENRGKRFVFVLAARKL